MERVCYFKLLYLTKEIGNLVKNRENFTIVDSKRKIKMKRLRPLFNDKMMT